MRRKKYERNTDGLRDAIFDQLEDLRIGESHPEQVTTFCRLVGNVLASLEADVRKEELDQRRTEFTTNSQIKREAMEIRRRELELRQLPPPRNGNGAVIDGQAEEISHDTGDDINDGEELGGDR